MNMKFSTDLWDGFNIVSQKTECGLSSVRDMLAFFKKRSQAEDEYGRTLIKLAKSAQSTKRVAFRGEHGNSTVTESPSVVKCWQSLIALTEDVGNKHVEVAKSIDDRVIEPVSCMIKDQEKKQKVLVSDGEKLVKQLNAAYASLEKAKKDYQKLMNEAEVAERVFSETQVAPDAKAKDVAKLESKAIACREKATLSDADYHTNLKHTNDIQKQFHEVEMPHILDALQEWERVRSHLVRQNCKKFVQALEATPEFITKANSKMCDAIDSINNDTDIEFFINENKTYNLPPDPITFLPYTTPENISEKVSSKSKKFRPFSRKFGGKADAHTPEDGAKDGVFATDLEYLMEKEREEAGPNVDVPRVLTTLSKVILTQGPKTEGLFRIPGEARDVQRLKKQFDEGIYEAPDEVHNAAALFKLWLRELPDPLVPSDMYDDAAKANNPADALIVYDKLPEIHRVIIEHVLYDMLRPLCSDEIVAVTRMGLDNMAMVFAPSFLRCPHEDPMVIMGMAESEKVFVKNLMLGLWDSINTGKRKRLMKNPPSSIVSTPAQMASSSPARGPAPIAPAILEPPQEPQSPSRDPLMDKSSENSPRTPSPLPQEHSNPFIAEPVEENPKPALPVAPAPEEKVAQKPLPSPPVAEEKENPKPLPTPPLHAKALPTPPPKGRLPEPPKKDAPSTSVAPAPAAPVASAPAAPVASAPAAPVAPAPAADDSLYIL